jgi:hypothetical protein
MHPLQRLSTIPAGDWPAIHRRALVQGRCEVLDPEDERLAAADELVALAVPALVRLIPVALIADGGSSRPRACARALRESAAPVLRLLDRALAAHARDIEYATDAWLERSFECAHVRAQMVSGMLPEDGPLGLLVEGAAEAVADAVMALHRDRFDVPQALVDALASLVVVYAAGTAIGA